MSERDWARRGRVERVSGMGAGTTVVVDLAGVGIVGPLTVPVVNCEDVVVPVAGGSARTYGLRVRVGDTVVVADVGATPDTELVVVSVTRA